MKRFSIGRTIGMALAFLVAGGALVPAAAQQAGERITIFVPDLAPKQGASDRFGENVAKELRKLIEDLHTHQTVTEREIRNARRQFKIDEERLYECTTAKQLAMQKQWGLVLCAQYAPAGDREVRVDASFQGATTSDRFDVPAFTANERDPKAAAQQILSAFDRFQSALRSKAICNEYVQSEAWEDALNNCNTALGIAPNDEGALYQKAYILWNLDRHQEALETVDKLLEINPIKGDALKLAGIVATEMEAKDRARGYFDRYMELNPGDVGVRLTLATEIANAGDPEAALEFARGGLEVEPDNMNLVTYVGHFAANAAAKAESELARTQDANGRSEELKAKIQQFYSTAAESYARVFEESGTETDAQILEKLIISLFKLGRIDEAVSLGERATAAKPDNARIWVAHSRALQEAGKGEQALAAIEKAESLAHSDAALTQRKANLLLQMDRPEEAIAALQAGVEKGQFTAPQAFQTVFAFAFNQKYQKDQWDAAYRIFDMAEPLAVAEENRLARNFWRGYILFLKGQRAHEPMTAESAAKAKPLFEQALELFKASRGYEQILPSADVPKLLDNVQRFIDIQEALIKRGR